MIKSKKQMAFYLALAANALWASSFVGAKITLLSWGPYTAAVLRLALSSLVLVIAYKLLNLESKAPKNIQEWVFVSLVGLILGGLYALQLSGMTTIESGLSAAIMLLAPLLLLILAPLVAKEGFELKKAIAAVLGAIGGVVLLYENLSMNISSNIGVWLTFGAALCLALFTLANRRFSKSISHPTMTLYSLIIGSLVLLPFSVSELIRVQSFNTENLLNSSLALFYLATVCTALPFFIWNKATAMTEAKNLASTMHLKTPLAIIFGVILLNEAPTWSLFFGVLIVSFSIWLSQASSFSFFKSKKAKLQSDSGFRPDLIIEATNLCDRACKGCYAANLFTGNGKKLSNGLNLNPTALTEVFNQVGSMHITSIRGGEPTLNPEIEKLLEVSANYSKMVILETHGRWIEKGSKLLDACSKFGISVKISFDSMHGLSKEELFNMCELLDQKSVNYLIAITEFTEEEFLKTRSICSWATNEQVIFQKKAKSLSELVKPLIGVVKTSGILEATLTTKKYFTRGQYA